MQATNPSEKNESIEMTVCENGVINVHRPESDKAHSVFTDGQKAIRCSCKGHKYHGRCTHQDEVESRPIVLSAASALRQDIVTDGGTDTDISYHTEPEHLGGSRYARCNECGAESVEDSEGDYGIMHDSDCSNNDMHMGIVSPDGEY